MSELNLGYNLSSADTAILNGQGTFIQFIGAQASSTAAFSSTYIPQFTGNMLFEIVGIASTTGATASDFTLTVTQLSSEKNNAMSTTTFNAFVSGDTLFIAQNISVPPMTPLTFKVTRAVKSEIVFIKYQELTTGIIH